MQTVNNVDVWRVSQTWIQPSIEFLDLSFYKQKIISETYSVIDAKAETQDDLGQSWFWSDEWQLGEQKVDEYIQKGSVEKFDTIEDFLRTL